MGSIVNSNRGSAYVGIGAKQQGDPQTVKYHELPALLLNELQKALKRIEALEARMGVCCGTK